MLDGKSLNSVLDNNCSARCNVCLKIGKDLSLLNPQDFSHEDKKIGKNIFQYSLPILHCRIKVMEFLLSIGYLNKNFDKCPSEKKEIIKKNKMNIQKKIKNEFKIIVDSPKQGN